MKTVIKTSAIAFLMVMAFQFSFAQRMNPQERAQRQTDSMLQKISSLTDQQKDSVKAINLEFANAMSAAFQNSNGDRDAMRSAFQSLRSAEDARFKAVLNDDQYKQYEQWREDQRSRMRQRNGGGNN